MRGVTSGGGGPCETAQSNTSLMALSGFYTESSECVGVVKTGSTEKFHHVWSNK